MIILRHEYMQRNKMTTSYNYENYGWTVNDDKAKNGMTHEMTTNLTAYLIL